eukprot:1805926-Pleurochrysis_carterae.AAC.1
MATRKLSQPIGRCPELVPNRATTSLHVSCWQRVGRLPMITIALRVAVSLAAVTTSKGSGVVLRQP